jgi:hypothetical protein
MENEEVVTSAFNIVAFSNRAIIDFISWINLLSKT